MTRSKAAKSLIPKKDLDGFGAFILSDLDKANLLTHIMLQISGLNKYEAQLKILQAQIS